jgi:hypothetical protein
MTTEEEEEDEEVDEDMGVEEDEDEVEVEEERDVWEIRGEGGEEFEIQPLKPTTSINTEIQHSLAHSDSIPPHARASSAGSAMSSRVSESPLC